jgi:hypothetical protein
MMETPLDDSAIIQALEPDVLTPAMAFEATLAVVKPLRKLKELGLVVETVACIHIDGVLPVRPGGGWAPSFSISDPIRFGGPSTTAYKQPACRELVGGAVIPAQLKATPHVTVEQLSEWFRAYTAAALAAASAAVCTLVFRK